MRRLKPEEFKKLTQESMAIKWASEDISLALACVFRYYIYMSLSVYEGSHIEVVRKFVQMIPNLMMSDL